MNKDSEYSIPYLGLSAGMHRFEFDLADDFFADHPCEGVSGGALHVTLDLDRHETHLALNFSLEGTVEVACDRCSDRFLMPLSAREKLVVKFADRDEEIDDDIITINRENNEINIAHFLFEYINLHLPVRRLHPQRSGSGDGCNAEALSRLEELSSPANGAFDPRWEALKQIKNLRS